MAHLVYGRRTLLLQCLSLSEDAMQVWAALHDLGPSLLELGGRWKELKRHGADELTGTTRQKKKLLRTYHTDDPRLGAGRLLVRMSGSWISEAGMSTTQARFTK
jgi:hypothetical protein